MYCLYFLCERKFYARTHVKITRKRKTSLRVARSTMSKNLGYLCIQEILVLRKSSLLRPPLHVSRGEILQVKDPRVSAANRTATRTFGDKKTTTKPVVSFEFKVARYSFSGPIPPKFEHKLRRHKQSFGKIANTVVLDKDENLL